MQVLIYCLSGCLQAFIIVNTLPKNFSLQYTIWLCMFAGCNWGIILYQKKQIGMLIAFNLVKVSYAKTEKLLKVLKASNWQQSWMALYLPKYHKPLITVDFIIGILCLFVL